MLTEFDELSSHAICMISSHQEMFCTNFCRALLAPKHFIILYLWCNITYFMDKTQIISQYWPYARKFVLISF